jgi:lipoprotein signal peptidase
MFARKTNTKKLSTSAVVTAMTMLVGILFIAYGHFQNSSSVLYVGLLITLAGALSGIVRIVVQGKA